ncbi:MAG: DUF92 domain-containing protein [Acidobacteriota bacterium]|nr:DUF92 domain-containing protein [Acidobacteriota bacterium]
MAQIIQVWQSKLVLLLVLPFVAASVVLEAHWWATQATPVALWTVGLSLLLGLVAFKLRSATLGAAAAGAAITASLMFSTATMPYLPWHTALMPMLGLMLLTAISTRLGRAHKERLGTAESRSGRTAAQVAANLGVAAIVSNELVQNWLADTGWFARATQVPMPLFAVGLAALAEAAADTVSSELGQVLSARPRMLTTLRRVDPGTDGAISLGGSLAGVLAAGIVAAAGAWALHGGAPMLAVSWTGGVFGLFFDSLLGATLERRGWLNNDGVNFLSTASASAFALALLAILTRTGIS